MLLLPPAISEPGRTRGPAAAVRAGFSGVPFRLRLLLYQPTGGGLERRSPGRGSHLLAYSEALIDVLQQDSKHAVVVSRLFLTLYLRGLIWLIFFVECPGTY